MEEKGGGEPPHFQKGRAVPGATMASKRGSPAEDKPAGSSERLETAQVGCSFTHAAGGIANKRGRNGGFLQRHQGKNV